MTTTQKGESPIIVKTREELIFLLSEAAALEHMVLCGYLFAVFTIKDEAEEGLTTSQLKAVRSWERIIRDVSSQEMLHLSLANNLLSSIGAAPYFGRPNFPHPTKYFAPRVQLALLPFGEKALRHFLFLERPESFDMEDAPGFEITQSAVPNTLGDEIVPEAQAFSTVGHLYRGIENGFIDLSTKLGEKRLFVGSPHCQADEESFGWPELVQVTDLASARKAIETIITEGEGARGEWNTAHFGKFYHVLNEYLELKRSDPSFEPGRPAIPACARPRSDARPIARITDHFTAEVSDLFNASYTLTLQLLSRCFMHTETTMGERKTLSDAAVSMMIEVLDPLGKQLTRLPIGERHPGHTAGPSFEMYPVEYLLPHKHAAWVLLHERLVELGSYCDRLLSRSGTSSKLGQIKATFERLSTSVEPHATASRSALEHRHA